MADSSSPGTSRELIERYFALALSPDRAAYVDQFADDAVVTDDGHVHRGRSAVETWRGEVPSVSYEILDVTVADRTGRATVAISGDFPGSPVTLFFDFAFDANLIRTLDIHL
jgi:hypothetical protein